MGKLSVHYSSSSDITKIMDKYNDTEISLSLSEAIFVKESLEGNILSIKQRLDQLLHKRVKIISGNFYDFEGIVVEIASMKTEKPIIVEISEEGTFVGKVYVSLSEIEEIEDVREGQ